MGSKMRAEGILEKKTEINLLFCKPEYALSSFWVKNRGSQIEKKICSFFG
jgi:hypothetical protein